MKQTAVEWLVQEISSDRVGQAIIETFLKEFEQAKEMEKEQLISFGYWQIEYIDAEIGDLIYNKVPEEVYKEIYNK